VLRGQHTDSSDLDILIDRALESTLSKLSKYATSSAWRSVCRSRFWPQREFVERQLDGTQFQFLRTCNGSAVTLRAEDEQSFDLALTMLDVGQAA
jgi:hypothetical protein